MSSPFFWISKLNLSSPYLAFFWVVSHPHFLINTSTVCEASEVEVHHVLLFPVPLLIYALLWLHDHLAKPRSLIKRAPGLFWGGFYTAEAVEVGAGFNGRWTAVTKSHGFLVASANPGWIWLDHICWSWWTKRWFIVDMNRSSGWGETKPDITGGPQKLGGKISGNLKWIPLTYRNFFRKRYGKQKNLQAVKKSYEIWVTHWNPSGPWKTASL